MHKIIGIAKTDFTTKDGTHIEGMSLYVTEPLDPNRGSGEAGEKIFLSTAKLALLGFIPEVGNEVEVLYNRYGKVQTLRLVDEVVIE